MIAAIDSNIFIYWLDPGSAFHQQAVALLESLTRDGVVLTCSTLTATEILSKPGVPSGVVTMLPVEWWDVNLEIAKTAGTLRQTRTLGLQDALHIASALASHASVFYTNDWQLSKLKQIENLIIKPLV